MVKKRAAAMTKVLALSVLAALFIAGAGAAGGCLKVPTMTWSDACLKACNTPARYNLCQETLLHSPDSAEATVYALAAAQRAKGSFDATMARVEQLLRSGGSGVGSIPGVERAAYLHCIGYYTEASSHMAFAVGDMSTNCVVQHTVLEYSKSLAAMQNCGGELMALQDSPLVALNAADYDLALVANNLGALIWAPYS